ncbi:hypothetical protein PuT2_12200 [Pusillimonas sp. T2]|nr:hypothetical protein PuT2_12200 [Pusillimonas sp. T2]
MGRQYTQPDKIFGAIGCSAKPCTDKLPPRQGKPCFTPIFGRFRSQPVHSFFYFVKLTTDQANQGTCYSKTLRKKHNQLFLNNYLKL